MMIEEKMIKKIGSGQSLSEKELKSLVYEGNEISLKYGENGKWTRRAESIIKLGGRYFSIIWEEGLTECQEDVFQNQPIEVEKREYDKMIHVVEWVTKENTENDK